MKYLSLELLNENLSKAENAEFIEAAPSGFTDDFYNKFIRVLTQPAKEVADIDSETIIEMLERAEELFGTLCLDDQTFNAISGRLNACVSCATATKRKIL